MPFQALDTPSLPVGILHQRIEDTCPDVTVVEYPGALRFGEYLFTRSNGELTPKQYVAVADRIEYLLGDWVFAGALYDDPQWRLEEMRDYARSVDLDLAPAEYMRGVARDYVQEAATEILAMEPSVVGFTTTFMQTVSSLAVAREIKRRRPGVKIVFGGANCEERMGHALHRNHRFVDFVVRGEGERALPHLLQRIAAGVEPRDIPGVCWWDGESSVANPELPGTVPPELIPSPNYSDWFAALDTSPLAGYLSPYLFVEASRGCWWGERHHCTFCGLNDALIAYRSKPAQRFWEELSRLVTQHRVLDVMTADNIMDASYYRELLPLLERSEWDLRLQFEAKANVDAEKVAKLAAAGVCTVQFGIESLSSRVLAIMDKGTTGTANVRALREAETHHVTVLWNYLYGFPGEDAEDYWSIIDQIPALVHLQPPGSVGRIALERFSPYFERPELGFADRTPLRFYRYVYDLPPDELADLAYFFESRHHGISGDVEKALIDAVDQWKQAYVTSSLYLSVGPDEALRIHDHREGWPRRIHTLTGWQRDGYEGLQRGRTVRSLHTYLAQRGHDLGIDELTGWLSSLVREGLVFVDADRYVALATKDVAVRFERGGHIL